MTKENALIRVVVEVNHHRAAEVQFLNSERSNYGLFPDSVDYTIREFLDKVIEHQCIVFNTETELNKVPTPEPITDDIPS